MDFLYPILLSLSFTTDSTVNIVADRYNLQPEFVKAVLTVESTFCKYRKGRIAWGCAQIHPKTASGLRMDHRIYVNDQFNIDAGMKYMKSLKRVCAYNVGNVKEHNMPACLRYETKLAKLGIKTNSLLKLKRRSYPNTRLLVHLSHQ